TAFSTRCGKAGRRTPKFTKNFRKEVMKSMAGNALMGTYEHTMDAKGRMAFPTKLRERLGAGFIVTIGLDGCLYVYSNDDWEIFTEKLQTLTGAKAKAAKMLIVNACVVEPDKQGRILVPQNLREYAGLDHDVTVLGVINRAEIWDSAKFKAFSSEITNDMLSEALADLAF
ncbi:MAG: division/cell wall cluster transcriptional repressor MraZ, partial [Muribaculaceae bacterium]|nr:division/cell wall cluster transcriptional repressor MraZ [Muribaculaceae bacterium]